MQRTLLILLLLVPLTACGQNDAHYFSTPVPESTRTVTIIGDAGNGDVLGPATVWADAAQSRKVGDAYDGEHVTLIERDGTHVHIRTAAGVEGWVAQQFVKELNVQGVK